jgi:hypothetical protein
MSLMNYTAGQQRGSVSREDRECPVMVRKNGGPQKGGRV